MSATIMAWMLTYLAHSTLLLSAAWLAWRFLPREALAVKEALWKTALVGGLLTATLQLGLGFEPRLGVWRLGGLEVATAGAADTAVREPVAMSQTPPHAVPETPRAEREEASGGLPALDRTLAPAPVSPETAAALSTGSTATRRPSWSARSNWSNWSKAVIATWAIGALCLVGWLAVSCLALARRLADRRGLAGGRLESLLRALKEATRMPAVRLSASARIASPLAFGWRRREICLPDRVASDMAEPQQELVLAHELAHHARRDPAWLIALRLCESLLFFQPLNRVARRCLQEIAEYRCDDWAVERTGRPVTLARCLADVAEWNLRRGAMLPVPSLAVERRRLGRRVERLLDRSYPFPPAARPKWLNAGVAVALVAIVLLAPGVSSGHSEPPAPEPSAPAVADGPLVVPSPALAPQALPAPKVRVTPAPAPVVAPVTPTRPLGVRPRVAPAPPVLVRPDSPELAPSGAVAVPLAPVAPVAPVASVTPAAAVAPSSPLARRPEAPVVAPAPPAPYGEWVIHEDAWPGAAMLPLAEPAEIDNLLAALAPSATSLGGEWAELAQEMAAAGEMPVPEVMAELVAYTRDLEELAALSPEASERLAELSRKMAEAARPDPEAVARIARLSAELAARPEHDPEVLARIAALSQELAATVGPDEETRAVYEDYARRFADEHRLSAEERQELTRVREELHRDMALRAAERREEMSRLRDEIRRELEAGRPDPEEMAALRDQIRAEIEASRPDREEMSRLRAELRAEIETSRPDREKLRRLHEDRVRELRERLPRDEARREVERIEREDLGRLREIEREQLREIGRLRSEVRERVTRDEAEALRAEIERLRAELRRLRDEE